jgi:hypothetical protein
MKKAISKVVDKVIIRGEWYLPTYYWMPASVFNGINDSTVTLEDETFIASVFNGINDSTVTPETETFIAHVFNGYNDGLISAGV